MRETARLAVAVSGIKLAICGRWDKSFFCFAACWKRSYFTMIKHAILSYTKQRGGGNDVTCTGRYINIAALIYLAVHRIPLEFSREETSPECIYSINVNHG